MRRHTVRFPARILRNTRPLNTRRCFAGQGTGCRRHHSSRCHWRCRHTPHHTRFGRPRSWARTLRGSRPSLRCRFRCIGCRTHRNALGWPGRRYIDRRTTRAAARRHAGTHRRRSALHRLRVRRIRCRRHHNVRGRIGGRRSRRHTPYHSHTRSPSARGRQPRTAAFQMHRPRTAAFRMHRPRTAAFRMLQHRPASPRTLQQRAARRLLQQPMAAEACGRRSLHDRHRACRSRSRRPHLAGRRRRRRASRSDRLGHRSRAHRRGHPNTRSRGGRSRRRSSYGFQGSHRVNPHKPCKRLQRTNSRASSGNQALPRRPSTRTKTTGQQLGPRFVAACASSSTSGCHAAVQGCTKARAVHRKTLLLHLFCGPMAHSDPAT